MIEYMTPGPAVTFSVPAPVLEYVPDDTYAAPAPVTKHVSFAPDDTYIAPASPRVNRDICGIAESAIFYLCCGDLFSCRGRVRSARSQASPSGTDRCGAREFREYATVHR